MTKNPRYAGKPLLRFLEQYVLWAIGELPEKSSKNLKKMTPILQDALGGQGEWHDVIAAAMHMEPNMLAFIRDTWRKESAIAREKRKIFDPQIFAEQFVDQMFPIDPIVHDD